ncbi:MAG: PAS domain S-box protein [Pirellulaceae bacterium]|nr:PAS domain S-box protein [Pirellulaceae bacterium]
MDGTQPVEELHDLRMRVAELEAMREEWQQAKAGHYDAEERLRTFFAYAPEALVMLDAETGRFIEVNPKAEAIFGRPAEELTRVGPFDLSPEYQPDGRLSREAGQCVIQAALQGEAPVFEWWHTNAQGEQFPCEVRLVRMPWGQRNVLRGSITEISDRKQLRLFELGRAQVLESVARGAPLPDVLQTLARTIEDLLPGMMCSVLLLDAEGQCLLDGAGPSLPEFYRQAVHGLRIGPGVGSCGTSAHTGQRVIVADVLEHPYWADFRELARQAGFRACWSEPIVSLDSHVLGTFAMYFRQPRQPVRVELDIIEIGAQLAAVAIEHDRTKERLRAANESLERRVAERTKELAAANRELERSNDELRQFAYIASHDLQEPIRMVSCFGQLLRSRHSEQLDDEARQWLDFVIEGGHRMQELINDLLDYSRVDGQARPFQAVPLARVLEHVQANLRSSIRDTGAVITHDELPVVVADKPQLIQLLQNLVANAIKFHETGPPRVHLSATRADDCWQVSVRDQGIGIDPRYHERIFDFFKRLHGRDRFPGTGIGLAICRRVVERHGGRIWVESQPGQGSTFHFTLPMREAP